MIRAVIYARFSTDLQNEKSIDDQIALCRIYAERAGLSIVDTYADRAKSGSSTIDRQAWQKLMRDADAHMFDVLITEDIDRISRSEADYHAARRRLTFLGIKIHTVHGGEISNIEGSVRAMLSAMYLENLAHKTRRGLAGVVAQGRQPGGRIYGYRSVAGKPGQLEIHEEQAAVIRRIYQEYVAGRTPRDIARDLTREGVPAPRGGRWAASTLNGSSRRVNGILRNPLYAGRIIWGRQRMVHDPDTGRRVPRVNPKSAWHEREVPHLAIIDHDLLDAAQRRKAERSHGHPVHHKKPRHILSGLLRCGGCGGGMSVSGKDKSGRARLYCTAHRESGTCPDPRTFYLEAVEEAVLSGLRRELKHPAVFAEYAKTYVEERSRLARDASKDRSRLERRLAAVECELERAVKALIKGTLPEDVAEKEIAALRIERDQLKIELEALPTVQNVVALHPAMLERYEAQLARLHDALGAGCAGGDVEAAAAIRDLVETVTVKRDPQRRGGVQVEIVGRLNALLLGETTGLNLFASVGKMVAGAGIEPATYGL
jgi:site-specific DNA recombinase